MWFGMKGVRSTIHYDESYNFYVQIFGNKRWYMAPPQYYSSCYLYPMAHPSTRQCQLDWPHTDADRFPRATAASNASAPGQGGEGQGMELITTVLKPDEILFIPPGWFHATEALDTNLAMNYWTKGINAQQHWMDLSLDCDRQWKALSMTMEERRATLLSTLLKLVQSTHAGKARKVPSPEVANGPSSELLQWWQDSAGPGGPRVLEAFRVVAERFSARTSDGFADLPSDLTTLPAAWLSSPVAESRYPECLSGSQRKIASVLSELAIKPGTEEARILLGDMLEGYGRGMMGNLEVGPFFAEVSARIAKIQSEAA